jgi:hypothetical protein
MFKDEVEFLPIWKNYYGTQAGEENLFLIDHGSDVMPASEANSMNLITLPKSPQSESIRVSAIRDFTSYLLHYYESVIYTDIDEMLVPQPGVYVNLVDFCVRNPNRVPYAVGLNIQHIPDTEAAFNPSEPILLQRSWVRFVGAMCKPLIVRKAVNWGVGFHSVDCEACVSDLFLFHLKWFDRDVGLTRLARQRQIMRLTDRDRAAAAHQLVSDDQWLSWLNGAAGLKRVEGIDFSITQGPIADYLALTFIDKDKPPNLQIASQELFRIPDIFRSCF